MEKRLCLILVLSFCVLLASCGQMETPAPDLYDAVDKLAAAQSFRLTIYRTDGVKPTTETCQIAHIDGTTYILNQSKGYANANLAVESTMYYEGNVCYAYNTYDTNSQTKYIYEDGYDITDIVCGSSLQGDITGFLDAFLATAPQCRVKDSMTVFSKSLSKEEYISLGYKVFTFIDEDYINLGNPSVSVKVDGAGYLREIDLKADIVRTGPSITFTIDQINEITSLEAPDFAKNYSSNLAARKEPLEDSLNSDLYVIKDGHTTRFHNNPFFLKERDGWTFMGFTGNYDESYVIPLYEVPEQVDGFPVKYINGLNDSFAEITVERLVVPKGILIDLNNDFEEEEILKKETLVFLCDTEEDFREQVRAWNNIVPFEERYWCKAAYFAGQWEYVDGIPTPLS